MDQQVEVVLLVDDGEEAAVSCRSAKMKFDCRTDVAFSFNAIAFYLDIAGKRSFDLKLTSMIAVH